MGAERYSGWEIPKEVGLAEFSRETGQRGDTEVAVRHTTHGLLVLSPMGSIALWPWCALWPGGHATGLQGGGGKEKGWHGATQVAPPPADPLQRPGPSCGWHRAPRTDPATHLFEGALAVALAAAAVAAGPAGTAVGPWPWLTLQPQMRTAG